MKRLVVIACAMSALPFHVLAAATTPILPGYWESTDTVTSPIQQTKTSRKCLTADQIESYLTGPVNNHYRCHYTDKKLDSSTFSMNGDCVDNNGLPAKVALQGVYTRTSFTMHGRIRISIGGLPIPIEASTDAHRISAECPAPGAALPSPPPADAASPASSAPAP